MSFIDEIKGCFEEWELPKEPLFRAVLFGESAVYFENVSGLRSYSPDQIVFNLKRGGVKVVGENLYVKKYCMGDVVVCGKILSIERV